MAKEFIKDFYGRILGSVETIGNKTTARDFYGRILSRGNQVTGLIWNPKYNSLVKNS